MPPWGFSWTQLSARLGHLVAFSTAWPSCWETRNLGHRCPEPGASTVPLEHRGGSSCLQSQSQCGHAPFTSPSPGVAWKWWWLYYQHWVGIFIKSTKSKNLQKDNCVCFTTAHLAMKNKRKKTKQIKQANVQQLSTLYLSHIKIIYFPSIFLASFAFIIYLNVHFSPLYQWCDIHKWGASCSLPVPLVTCPGTICWGSASTGSYFPG